AGCRLGRLLQQQHSPGGASDAHAARDWARRRTGSARGITMPLNRRELLQATGSALVGAAFAADKLGAAQVARGDDFSIENIFADFMRDIGGSAEDAGGRVLFTGRDPILQSPF